MPPRLPAEITLCTESEWPLTGRGPLASPWRAYAERSMLLPIAEFGLNVDVFVMWGPTYVSAVPDGFNDLALRDLTVLLERIELVFCLDKSRVDL